MIAITDLGRWASELARAYDAIAMVIRFDVAASPGADADALRVCLVMKNGSEVPWFAAGKGIEGSTWDRVPGRDQIARILSDERTRLPGLALYMNFCDVRPLIFAYRDGEEHIAGEELVDAPYQVLHPDRAELPSLEEFFLCWGRPHDD